MTTVYTWTTCINCTFAKCGLLESHIAKFKVIVFFVSGVSQSYPKPLLLHGRWLWTERQSYPKPKYTAGTKIKYTLGTKHNCSLTFWFLGHSNNKPYPQKKNKWVRNHWNTDVVIRKNWNISIQDFSNNNKTKQKLECEQTWSASCGTFLFVFNVLQENLLLRLLAPRKLPDFQYFHHCTSIWITLKIETTIKSLSISYKISATKRTNRTLLITYEEFELTKNLNLQRIVCKFEQTKFVVCRLERVAVTR